LSLIILWKNLLPSSCRRSASDRMLHARRSIVNDRKLREKALRRDIDISNTATRRCKVTIHYRSSDGPVLTGFYRHARHGREMCLLNYEFMMATVTASERARERESSSGSFMQDECALGGPPAADCETNRGPKKL